MNHSASYEKPSRQDRRQKRGWKRKKPALSFAEAMQ